MSEATIENGKVILRIGDWSEAFPVADLPGRIAFYRRMCERREGRYRRVYAPTVRALEALQTE